jgi:hypothetical protein
MFMNILVGGFFFFWGKKFGPGTVTQSLRIKQIKNEKNYFTLYFFLLM